MSALNLTQFAFYHRMIRGKIERIISNDLTIGRSDNDLPQYNEDEINTFIETNNENIEKTIETIISEYHNDDDLELLDENDPSIYSRISEYLYQYIDYGYDDDEGNEEEDEEEDDEDEEE